MVGVEAVAAAREVQVSALLVQHVIQGVVEPPEAVGRPAVAGLRRVVEDDVEDDLQARLVEGVDHRAELVPRLRRARLHGIGGLRGGEGDRVVSPEVQQAFAGQRVDVVAIVLVEFVDRQQLDRRDPQLAEIVGLLRQPGERPRVSHAGTGVDRVAPDVQLVEDGVLQRDGGADGRLALDHGVVHEAAPRAGRGLAPPPAVGDGPGVRIEQDHARIEPEAVAGGPVDPVAVAELDGEAVDPDMPVVPRPIEPGVELDLGLEPRCPGVAEDEPDRRGVAAGDGEVDAVRLGDRPQGEGTPAPDRQDAVAEDVFRLHGVGRRFDGNRSVPFWCTDRGVGGRCDGRGRKRSPNHPSRPGVGGIVRRTESLGRTPGGGAAQRPLAARSTTRPLRDVLA